MSLNLYTYGQGNPVYYVDPSGHKVRWNQWDDLLGGAISGVGDEFKLPKLSEIGDAITGLYDLVVAVTSGDIGMEQLAEIGLDAVFGDFVYLKDNWNIISDKNKYSNAEINQFGFHSGKVLTQVVGLVAGGAGVAVKVKSLIDKVDNVKDAAKATKKLTMNLQFFAKGAKITTKQAMEMAKGLGFKKTKGFVSNGQAVFKKGRKYITIDVDSHNGGVWKMADSVKNLGSRKSRMGTYDSNLNRIGD